MESTSKISDITFIGSGISTSFTLINLLKSLKRNHTNSKTISINIIDKYPEFNLGIPYGSRSGYSTLLITSLRNFLPEIELKSFKKWLNKNKKWLLKEFEDEGGWLSKKWISDNQQDIDSNQWDELFIPRRFFGCYIDNKVSKQIKKLTKLNYITIKYIAENVIDIDKTGTNHTIIFENGNKLITKKVVLSVGSLPTNYLWKNELIVEDKNLLFFNAPYELEIKNTLIKISDFLKQRENKKTNILVVGANASALEILYKINDVSEEKNENIHYTFISTLGLLPDAEIDHERKMSFRAKNLNQLKGIKQLTAETIADATFKDLDDASKINLGAASTVDTISHEFGALLGKLTKKELESFACNYGNKIGQRQRCAGIHYSNVINNLKQYDRFNHISGRFQDLAIHNDDYYLEFLDTNSQEVKDYDTPFQILINCVGSKNFESEELPIIFKNLIKKKYIIPNKSKIGVYVNESLQASKDFYVMGPLLAGNVVNNSAIWHVEHCGRIIWLSKVLSEVLINDLLANTKNESVKYNLTIHDLNTDSDVQIYTDLLKKYWGNNIYYTYNHLSYFRNNEDTLKYFLFSVNNSLKVIMPVILRPITTKNTLHKYFDITTPYGYSGPLLNINVEDNGVLKEFWCQVDHWYLKNNVISEFIRFSLNENHHDYSGILVSSLTNVKGKLQENFDDQWDHFSSKVRNNYRKAVSNNLIFKSFEKEQINKDIIKLFYTIYVSTMERNNADSLYYFSQKYFEELILNNTNEFCLTFAFLNETPISTELIIKYNNTIFAFLGGTDANYYNYRPNDFLRAEIIKWAIENQMENYVLGGGLSDYDGLYKSKKALFPTDEDVIFYTGRKIINYPMYEQLCSEHIENYSDTNFNPINYYFPLYRCDKINSKI